MSGDAELPAPFHLIGYRTIGSTNDEAKRLARIGAPHGVVVSATRQTSGRGRRGRRWESPPGNLYASLLLRPRCRAAAAAQLGFAAAVAIAEAATKLAPGVELRCKWPNDVLAGGKKVAGVLLESEITGAGDVPAFVVIGCGVNLAVPPTFTPYPATSLAQEGAPIVAPSLLLAAFVRQFGERYRIWQEQGFGPIREAWLARAVGLGQEVEVRLERDTLRGCFIDLDEDGALLLGGAAGRRRIAAGDVFPVAA